MGYMSHNAIVVSGTNADSDGRFKGNDFAELRAEIAEMCESPRPGEIPLLPVSPVLPSANGTLTFLIGPDGGKEGHSISDRGNELREEVKELLRRRWTTHAGMFLDWAEIQYGNDDCVTLIVDHSDKLAEEAE